VAVDAAFAGQCGVDLPDPVNTVVVLVDLLDPGCGLLIPQGPGSRWAALAGVVRTRGDRDLGLGEDGTNRFDPELILVLIDVLDDQREGRSNSAAKKTAALFKIPLARRSSRFSRSSAAIRSASVLLVPGRSPASISAFLTHTRRASGWIPGPRQSQGGLAVLDRL
jgi:hypothetical protein